MPAWRAEARSTVRLEFRIAGGSRERDYVPDVFHAGEVHHHAFEAHAEAGVFDAAEAAEVEVPPIGGFVEAVGGHLADSGLQEVVALFALAAADDFADSGRKDVHRGDGF